MFKNYNIAVVIPAYNEEGIIGKVIDSIPNYVDTIIVVDDGSSDSTPDIAKEKGSVVVTHNKNRGVGAAIQTGVSKALELETDVMVNIDADGQFSPKDINKLIEPIINEKADFVTASRFKDPNYYPEMSKIKLIGNKIMAFFISKISGQKFYDVSCGFRAYSKRALFSLNLFGNFTYTQESFLGLAFKNLSILEIPMKVKGTREKGKSKVASNLFKYTYQTLKIILMTLMDYKPFTLFSLISGINLLVGLGFGFFLLFHFISAGEFSPHKWAGFTSGFFIVLSIISFAIGIILEMFARMRQNQEEMLYYIKKQSGLSRDNKCNDE